MVRAGFQVIRVLTAGFPARHQVRRLPTATLLPSALRPLHRLPTAILLPSVLRPLRRSPAATLRPSVRPPTRRARGGFLQRAHEAPLGSGVKAGGGLVKEEEVGIAQKLHRNAGALFLAAAQ